MNFNTIAEIVFFKQLKKYIEINFTVLLTTKTRIL